MNTLISPQWVLQMFALWWTRIWSVVWLPNRTGAVTSMMGNTQYSFRLRSWFQSVFVSRWYFWRKSILFYSYFTDCESNTLTNLKKTFNIDNSEMPAEATILFLFASFVATFVFLHFGSTLTNLELRVILVNHINPSSTLHHLTTWTILQTSDGTNNLICKLCVRKFAVWCRNESLGWGESGWKSKQSGETEDDEGLHGNDCIYDMNSMRSVWMNWWKYVRTIFFHKSVDLVRTMSWSW